LSVTLFEKTPILQVLSQHNGKDLEDEGPNQLELFD